MKVTNRITFVSGLMCSEVTYIRSLVMCENQRNATQKNVTMVCLHSVSGSWKVGNPGSTRVRRPLWTACLFLQLMPHKETDLHPTNQQSGIKTKLQTSENPTEDIKPSRENLKKSQIYSCTDSHDKLVHQMACAIFVMLTGLVPEICWQSSSNVTFSFGLQSWHTLKHTQNMNIHADCYAVISLCMHRLGLVT